MYKILNAEKLSANVFLMDVEAPRVAKHCLPGQVRHREDGRSRRENSAYNLRL